MKKAIIVLSGGMDSGVLCAELATKGFVNNLKEPEPLELYALTFQYGSNHNKAELDKAMILAGRYCKHHKIIYLDFMKEAFKSSLLEGADKIPEGHYAAENMKSTVVPFRNGIMLAIATGYAESINAEHIYLGSHSGDHYIYPDCRPEFNFYMAKAIEHGTEDEIEFKTPYTGLNKRDIGLKGKNLGLNFEDTYTCYKGDPETHCGVCGACVERKEALEGFDPTHYLV